MLSRDVQFGIRIGSDWPQNGTNLGLFTIRFSTLWHGFVFILLQCLRFIYLNNCWERKTKNRKNTRFLTHFLSFFLSCNFLFLLFPYKIHNVNSTRQNRNLKKEKLYNLINYSNKLCFIKAFITILIHFRDISTFKFT